jgi:hypothetical protein
MLLLLLLLCLAAVACDNACEIQDVQYCFFYLSLVKCAYPNTMKRDAFRDAITDKAFEALCFDPITWQLMREPMLCSDGEVYDKSTLAAGSFVSVTTGKSVTALGPNKTLRRLICEMYERLEGKKRAYK